MSAAFVCAALDLARTTIPDVTCGKSSKARQTVSPSHTGRKSQRRRRRACGQSKDEHVSVRLQHGRGLGRAAQRADVPALLAIEYGDRCPGRNERSGCVEWGRCRVFSCSRLRLSASTYRGQQLLGVLKKKAPLCQHLCRPRPARLFLLKSCPLRPSHLSLLKCHPPSPTARMLRPPL